MFYRLTVSLHLHRNLSDPKPTYLMPNISDAKPIWFRIYLMPNLSDAEPIWFRTYLVSNLSGSEPTWFRTNPIPNPDTKPEACSGPTPLCHPSVASPFNPEMTTNPPSMPCDQIRNKTGEPKSPSPHPAHDDCQLLLEPCDEIEDQTGQPQPPLPFPAHDERQP
jgi:hypothetical protein